MPSQTALPDLIEKSPPASGTYVKFQAKVRGLALILIKPVGMSALGQKRTYAVQNVMSALPPKADMCGATKDVRFGPKADIVATSTLDTHCECHTGEALAMSFGQTVTSSFLRHWTMIGTESVLSPLWSN